MKILKYLLIAIFVAVSLSGCNSKSQNLASTNQPTDSETSQEAAEQDFKIELTADEDNTNALELSKQNLDLIYENYDFGVFVTEINGTKADDEHFWALYLNNEFAEKSADQLILKKGDTLEWRYEKII